MVKHTRTTADELFVFDNFAGLVLKGLKRLLTQFSLFKYPQSWERQTFRRLKTLFRESS